LTDRAAALIGLEKTVRAWQANDVTAAQFCLDWKTALNQGGFSARAHEISDQFLVRMESAQAFGGGESCSFSATEMQGAFVQLLEKLRSAK
jgi:hypothetical protein